MGRIWQGIGHFLKGGGFLEVKTRFLSREMGVDRLSPSRGESRSVERAAIEYLGMFTEFEIKRKGMVRVGGVHQTDSAGGGREVGRSDEIEFVHQEGEGVRGGRS